MIATGKREGQMIGVRAPNVLSLESTFWGQRNLFSSSLGAWTGEGSSER